MRPGGLKTTGAFRAKALLLYLRDRLGRDTARRFVELIGGRGIFDDETRPISQTLWLRALREFARLAGPKAVGEIGPYLVHPENLGAWSRLLRGATHPSQVYEQLGLVSEGLPGDSLWVSSEATAQGCVCVADPPTPEERGDRELVYAALQAELEAVPYLLGLPRARVRWTETPEVDVTFTVRWRQPGERWLLGAVLVTAAWSVFAAVCVALRHSFWQEWIPRGRDYLVFAVPFPISIFLWLARRDALRHAETRMQRMRILALEREAVLRQTRHKEISRPHEEPIIAGQYRVGTQLGVGATGAVWEATRLTDNTQVAIKLLRTAVVHDVRASDRLRREAEALGLSWHPNVVEVFDSGLLPSGVGFLVMERLYGETLAERLERLGPLPGPLVKKLALEAVDALFAIHSAGVVHRDIKPGNLFVEKADDEVRLKIIDFGVAQVSWAETRLTRSGVRIGTVGYASPEQEDGSDVDGRSDLYGLGIVLYECLTGKGPRSDAPLSDEALAGLPEDWAGFLDKLVRTDRAERYASAREAREALLAVKSIPPSALEDDPNAEGVA